jgi:Ala-tRNA(Pro) deacylase
MSDTAPDARLAGGEPPASPEHLFRRLRELDIDVTTLEHPPVHTVEEAKTVRGTLVGCHTKNLFLRDKKGGMWLVVCQEDRSVDLRDLARRLGAKRFSFGSAARLMQNLGVVPGAVTPFAVINDRNGAVRVAIDRAILDREPLNFHPLDNAMTTSIGAQAFLRFLDAENHTPHIIDFDLHHPPP